MPIDYKLQSILDHMLKRGFRVELDHMEREAIVYYKDFRYGVSISLIYEFTNRPDLANKLMETVENARTAEIVRQHDLKHGIIQPEIKREIADIVSTSIPPITINWDDERAYAKKYVKEAYASAVNEYMDEHSVIRDITLKGSAFEVKKPKPKKKEPVVKGGINWDF